MTAFGTRDKIMSTTRAEFEASLDKLHPGARLDTDGRVRFELAPGHAEVRFEQMEPRRITDLVRIQQARVTLRFDGVSPEAEAAFVRRFEIYFQRGGG